MRVLLTGATGFIGSHILDTLLQQRLAVTVLVLPETLAELRHRAQVQVILGSLDDQRDLARAVRGVDLVIHAAGGVLGRPRAELWAITVQGTANLLRAATATHVRRFVMLSSTAVYRPPEFTFQYPITENSALGPMGSVALRNYGDSKIEAEWLIFASHRRSGL